MKRKVFVVFGTRPEIIKMAPVIKALEKEKEIFDFVACSTGQHRHILDQMLGIFDIRPDIDLDLMEENQTLPAFTAKSVLTLSDVIEKVNPDLTLVQGDTTTAMVASLASFYAKVPVGHVEAGLRTGDCYNPFPEEINRRLISILATYHFAPTRRALETLCLEGHLRENIYQTGNTVIDALMFIAKREKPPEATISLKHEKYILVTSHRRENFCQPIKNICNALKEIVVRNNVEIVFPVHPNPNIRGPVEKNLGGEKRIHLISPLGYEDFIYTMKNAYLLLTDSGGVQEEAPSLGKPVLVLRDTTERPEAVEAGVARLVGTETKKIVQEVENLLNNKSEYLKMAKFSNPFGDGTAAERIIQILKQRIN